MVVHMPHEEWQELSEELGRRMWVIECADMMITPEEAERRWYAMPNVGSGRRAELTHIAGCALIALTDMGRI